MAETKAQFIARLKTTSPAYAALPDEVLFSKFISKNPQFADRFVEQEAPLDQGTSSTPGSLGAIGHAAYLQGVGGIPMTPAQDEQVRGLMQGAALSSIPVGPIIKGIRQGYKATERTLANAYMEHKYPKTNYRYTGPATETTGEVIRPISGQIEYAPATPTVTPEPVVPPTPVIPEPSPVAATVVESIQQNLPARNAAILRVAETNPVQALQSALPVTQWRNAEALVNEVRAAIPANTPPEQVQPIVEAQVQTLLQNAIAPAETAPTTAETTPAQAPTTQEVVPTAPEQPTVEPEIVPEGQVPSDIPSNSRAVAEDVSTPEELNYSISLMGVDIPVASPYEAAREYRETLGVATGLLNRAGVQSNLLGDVNPLIKDAQGNVVGFVSQDGVAWHGTPGDPNPVPWTESTETTAETIQPNALPAPAPRQLEQQFTGQTQDMVVAQEPVQEPVRPVPVATPAPTPAPVPTKQPYTAEVVGTSSTEVPEPLKRLTEAFNAGRLNLEAYKIQAKRQGYDITSNAEGKIETFTKRAQAPQLNTPATPPAQRLTPEQELAQRPDAQPWVFKMEEVLKDPRVPANLPTEGLHDWFVRKGVKLDELQWNNFNEVTKGKAQIAKKDLLKWLGKNRFEFEVHIYDGKLSGMEPGATGRIAPMAKWTQYTIPNIGDHANYIYTLPHKAQKAIAERVVESMGIAEETPAKQARIKRIIDTMGNAGYNAAVHYGEFSKNLVGHARTNAVIVNGKIAGNIDEYQFDPIQDAYEIRKERVEELMKNERLSHAEASARVPKTYGVRTEEDIKINPNARGGLINVPMRETIQEHVTKDVLRRMILSGKYNYITMPKAIVQVKRWSNELQKVVDQLDFEKMTQTEMTQLVNPNRVNVRAQGGNIRFELTHSRLDNWLEGYRTGRYSPAYLNRHFSIDLQAHEYRAITNTQPRSQERARLLARINEKILLSRATPTTEVPQAQGPEEKKYMLIQGYKEGRESIKFFVNLETGLIEQRGGTNVHHAWIGQPVEKVLGNKVVNEIMSNTEPIGSVNEVTIGGRGMEVNYDIKAAGAHKQFLKDMGDTVQLQETTLLSPAEELLKGIESNISDADLLKVLEQIIQVEGTPTKNFSSTIIQKMRAFGNGTSTQERIDLKDALKAEVKRNTTINTHLRTTYKTHIKAELQGEGTIKGKEAQLKRYFSDNGLHFSKVNSQVLEKTLNDVTRPITERVEELSTNFAQEIFNKFEKNLQHKPRTPVWIFKVTPELVQHVKKTSSNFWLGFGAAGLGSKVVSNKEQK